MNQPQKALTEPSANESNIPEKVPKAKPQHHSEKNELSSSKFEALCEPPTPDQILYGKMKARARGFQLTTKPNNLGEWERTWERWRNDNTHWRKKIEKRPKIFCPTPLQRKALVWTGVYEAVEQVPAHVSMHTVKRSVMRKVRFSVGTVLACTLITWSLFAHWAPP